MNSSRASPTPAFGVEREGLIGVPTFTDLDTDLAWWPLDSSIKVKETRVNVTGVTLST